MHWNVVELLNRGLYAGTGENVGAIAGLDLLAASAAADRLRGTHPPKPMRLAIGAAGLALAVKLGVDAYG